MEDNIKKPQINPTWNPTENGSVLPNNNLNKIIEESENILDPFEEAEKKSKTPAVTEVPMQTQEKPVPAEIISPVKQTEPLSRAPFIKDEHPKNLQPEKPFQLSTEIPQKEEKSTHTEPNMIPEKPTTGLPLEEPAETSPLLSEIKETTKENPKSALWKTVLKTIGFFIGIFLFIYLFLNFPAVYAKVKFTIFPPEEIPLEEKPKTNTIESVPQNTDKQIFFSFSEFAVSQPINYVAPAPEETTPPQEEPTPNSGGGSTSTGDNLLIIPKLGKRVPIVWNSPPDENTMLENLQKGVVHYAGTPLPDEGKGPIFISGHSSYYWWDKGKYKTVFANLDRLEEGDQLQIIYNGQVYTYQVFEKVVVTPDQVDVLNQVNESVLDLMTCVPVGTNQKRLIVKSKQI